MRGQVGYKAWSGGNQTGLRIYADTIRRLRSHMRFPSQDGAFDDLDGWMVELEQGDQPSRYSRPAVVMLPNKQIQQCTLTIATLPPKSPQGYVTAPLGSNFADIVTKDLGHNVEADFQSSPYAETIILQPPPTEIEVEKQRRSASRALRKLSRPIRTDLVEQGMYFENLEYERRKVEIGNDMVIDWRVPRIDSDLPVLRAHDISCDIDVWDAAGVPKLCIEVKSLSGSPYGRFVLTRREYESRQKCRDLGIEYEIVVYGFANSGVNHARTGNDVRRVIGIDDHLNSEPYSYACW